MNEQSTFEEILERDGKVIFTNKGISMMPLLREGRDLMVIERRGETALRRLDAVLFRRPETTGRDAYVMHRILRINGDGTYWIIGDNCVSGDTVKDEDIIGILTAVVRDGKKTVTATNLSYRIYRSTWCRWYRLRIFLKNCAWNAGVAKRKIKSLFRKK
ncbi:MAG: S24/S26 family peptidase [Clostridia bacterium]|nr:S24/S26 family peptidase [Clostridia bacterium]